MTETDLAEGFRYLPGYLGPEAQAALVAELRALLAEAPLYRPTMPKSGRPFSVRMTNAGSHGWLSDRQGYRYAPRHPQTGRPWPAIPAVMERIWAEVADYPAGPECCLINFYAPEARMGLHRDQDEETFEAPVVSLSLGDSAVFRLGGPTRHGPTRSLKLHSGDVMILSGPARLAYHGIDRVLGGSSRLLPDGGRINLTLRRVTRPAGE
ncbi:alpha-ketoglutarate-dependent dioxygenase AlkB family protein [Pelagibius marinus]|uniref:alpha-ketoglutarate-dependent dioxygenase AlkB family protein n=1 Tax=Pelagibius marinus TaxID=2762760 RepID=UPI0018724844|nr:alpha-ketoglutarate-dependent dioxygenase AlkB [Pelagibius marinus]